MVDSAALRAVALRGVGVRVPPWVRKIILSGSSSSVERSLWEREVQGPIPWTPTERLVKKWDRDQSS